MGYCKPRIKNNVIVSMTSNDFETSVKFLVGILQMPRTYLSVTFRKTLSKTVS